jgi:hypothetical protein
VDRYGNPTRVNYLGFIVSVLMLPLTAFLILRNVIAGGFFMLLALAIYPLMAIGAVILVLEALGVNVTDKPLW